MGYGGDKQMLFVTTNHSGKMKGMVSINTSALNNPFCLTSHQNKNSVCSRCYSVRYERLRPTVSDRYRRNGLILSETVIEGSRIPIFNNLYVRFNSYGELVNKRHYDNLVRIAEYNDNAKFTLWTKRIDLIDVNYKPSNLKIIFSNPILDKVLYDIPKGCDGVFNVVSDIDESEVRDLGLYKCGGKKCIDCLRCYDGREIGVIVEKVK